MSLSRVMVPNPCRTSRSLGTTLTEMDAISEADGPFHDRDRDPSSSSWHLTDCRRSLPRVPPFFVLERTRAVVTDAMPSEVAGRISDWLLRQEGLRASFCSKKAEAFVKAPDGSQFYVRLFQCNSTPDGRAIIVEVQKKRGCSIRFHRMARAVLRSAAGSSPPPRPSPPSSAVPRRGETASAPLLLRQMRPTAADSDPSRFSRSSSSPSSGSSLAAAAAAAAAAPSAERQRDVVEDALERALTLLGKDRLDARDLGMESVAHLTDEGCVGRERAEIAAKALVFGEWSGGGVEGGGTAAAVAEPLRRNVLAATVAARPEDGGGSRGEDDDDDSRNGDESPPVLSGATRRRLAFAALSNAVKVLGLRSSAGGRCSSLLYARGGDDDIVTASRAADQVLAALAEQTDESEEWKKDVGLA